MTSLTKYSVLFPRSCCVSTVNWRCSIWSVIPYTECLVKNGKRSQIKVFSASLSLSLSLSLSHSLSLTLSLSLSLTLSLYISLYIFFYLFYRLFFLIFFLLFFLKLISISSPLPLISFFLT